MNWIRLLLSAKMLFFLYSDFTTIYQCKRHTRKASFANFPAALARRPSFRGPWLYFTIFRKDHYNNFYLSNTIKEKNALQRPKLVVYTISRPYLDLRYVSSNTYYLHIYCRPLFSLYYVDGKFGKKINRMLIVGTSFFFVILQSK